MKRKFVSMMTTDAATMVTFSGQLCMENFLDNLPAVIVTMIDKYDFKHFVLSHDKIPLK